MAYRRDGLGVSTFVGFFVAGILLVLVSAVVLGFIYGWVAMILLGILHSTLAWVPAWGIAVTWPGAILVALIGTLFHGSASASKSE